MAVTRLTLSLPSAIADDLTFSAARLGVSRSALVSDLLREIHTLASLLRAQDLPDANEAIRLRGESEEVLRERVAAIRAQLDEVDSQLRTGGDDDGAL